MNAVSYSIFESQHSVYFREKGRSLAQFVQFLPELIRSHHVVWSGWTMIVHHDDEVRKEAYWPTMERFSEAGLVKLIPMGNAPSLCGAMLWRMLPIFTGQYEYVACRDIDAMPMPRDRKCVEEFIASGLTMHCIHDNASHSGLMGGMIAVNCKQFVDRFGGDLVFGGDGWNVQGKDQNWLNRFVSPLVCDSLMIHSSKSDMSISDHASVRHPIPPRDGPADEVAPGIGICDWPSKAFAYYDAMDIPIINRIKEIERG